MVALVIVLNQKQYEEEILSTLVNFKVKGATMIDSQGMGRTIVNSEYMNISLFGSLRKLLNEQHSYSKTIFSVVSTDIIDNLVKAIKDIFAEKKPGVGFMFTLPVNNIYLLDK